jgi:hypothetical protein
MDEVDSELADRLPSLSTDDLVKCFADWRICGHGEVWDIADTLKRRGHTDTIIRTYGDSSGWEIRNGIEHLAYNSRSPVALQYMKTNFLQHLDDGENLYWPAMYLAKRCDRQALRYLNPGSKSKSIADKFSVSSAQFAETAELFGRCRYRPAIPYLVAIGLNAASLNLVDAADLSLRRFYPGAPSFDSPNSERKYFCARANRDGFHLKCEDE